MRKPRRARRAKRVRRTTVRRDKYYYLTGLDRNGIVVTLGPFLNEIEADRLGYDKYPGNYEVLTRKTSVLAIVTQEVKAQRLLTAGISLEAATKRAKHIVEENK